MYAGPGMGQDEFPDPRCIKEAQEARHQAPGTNVSAATPSVMLPLIVNSQLVHGDGR